MYRRRPEEHDGGSVSRDAPYVSIKPYLLHSIAVTLAIYGLPVITTIWIFALSDRSPSVLMVVLLSLLLTAAIAALGSFIWSRRPEAEDISFGELVVWRWLRRKRAEDRLAEATRLLGLDAAGTPTTRPLIDRRQQALALRELTVALEAKDIYTHGHSRRVEKHVERIGEKMRLPEADLDELCQAAALHDVGKIRVPDRLLRKPDVLTIEEKVAVEEHVLVGAALVAPAGGARIAMAVRSHHERWDGRGYPDGIAGREIPLFARIIAVADAYDAMTSTRPYRASLSHERALEVLRQEAGRQFDFEVVEAFAATIRAPVHTALGLAGLPLGFLREVAVPAKKLGAGSLAPTAGAAGSAAALTAAVLVPAAPPVPHSPQQRPPARVVTASEPLVAPDPARPAPAGGDGHERAGARGRAPASDALADRAVEPEMTEQLEEVVAAASELADAEAELGGSGDPAGDVRERKDREQKAAKRRDCPPVWPGKGQGEGNAQHCSPG